MITTVLPTPAPPKAPTLPPLVNGQIKSITLIPVSKISASVAWSTNSGAPRWIGRRSSVFTGPFSSTVLPVTSKIRPKTASPTGTLIGAPVLFTAIPRFNPSVEDIATARTTPSPKCC